MTRSVLLDPDGTLGDEWMFVVVECATGIRNVHQFGGTMNREAGVEGYLIPVSALLRASSSIPSSVGGCAGPGYVAAGRRSAAGRWPRWPQRFGASASGRRAMTLYLQCCCSTSRVAPFGMWVPPLPTWWGTSTLVGFRPGVWIAGLALIFWSDLASSYRRLSDES